MENSDQGNDSVVLVNNEDQYSLWPARKRAPEGWRVVHGPADKESCTAFVNEAWTDMRPRSLRQAMSSGLK